MLAEFGLWPELHPALARHQPPVGRTLDDPPSLILGKGRQEGEEAAPDWRREVEVGLVQHLDGSATFGDALHDVDAVHHRACRPIPFCDDEDVAGPECVDRTLELRSVLHRLTGGLLAEDRIAADGPQRPDLAVEVLGGRRDSDVSDQHPSQDAERVANPQREYATYSHRRKAQLLVRCVSREPTGLARSMVFGRLVSA